MFSARDKFEGVLLGTAVGDAIGLPFEGLSRRRVNRMLGAGPLRHRFLFGRGMCSDDTEHTAMVAQALLSSAGDPQKFARSLAWRFRGWLLGIPAGVGFATLRAILKLWIGSPPTRSGVFSAGNRPAMRTAIIGIYASDDDQRLIELVKASTRITHADPKADDGATAVALAARHGARRGPADVSFGALLDELHERIGTSELLETLRAARCCFMEKQTLDEYARRIGCQNGVSGYVLRTVPIALYAWSLSPGDFRAAVESVIRLGGDTDTTAAITGALVGATAGAAGIPPEWLNGIVDWPRSVVWLRRLAARLADACASRPARPMRLFWPVLVLRNVVFLIVVLIHGLRRMLPPY